jgi:hypothetical protein
MKQVTLIRMENDPEQGIFGTLMINGKVFCCTLEPPDKDNKKDVSCIPADTYVCAPYSSPKYPFVYEVTDVPKRSNILFHKGNTVHDTAGCILLGSSFGKLRHLRAVLNSGATFDKFRGMIGDNQFMLTVFELYL